MHHASHEMQTGSQPDIPERFSYRKLKEILPVLDSAAFWAGAALVRACQEWQGARNRDGYGLAHVVGVNEHLTHRIAYVLRHGSIGHGLIVRHTCDNPACMNPDHLELGTHSDNATDREQRGRGKWSDHRG